MSAIADDAEHGTKFHLASTNFAIVLLSSASEKNTRLRWLAAQATDSTPRAPAIVATVRR